MRVAMRFRIAGRVQGVYFRACTKAKADALHLTGWVKNLPDGHVECVACGDQPNVDKLKEWLQHGPELAEVTELEEHAEQPQEWVTFHIV